MQRGILLFGYPGSGKGTQGRMLSALPGFRHVAMGEILRSLAPNDPQTERVNGYIRRGDLVPDDLVMELFFGYIDRLKPEPDDFLVIDGVPRSARQTEQLNRRVQVIKIFKLSVYDERLVMERLRRRAREQGRPDDATDEIIRHRLRVYREETESCIRSYPGTVLTRIYADQPMFDVHLDITQSLGKMRHIQFR